jgi:hypothetical protein
MTLEKLMSSLKNKDWVPSEKLQLIVKTFANILVPEHQRTSCSDENSNGNEYFNEFGYPRCCRCALLYLAKNGHWPYHAEIHSLDTTFRFIVPKDHPLYEASKKYLD